MSHKTAIALAVSAALLAAPGLAATKFDAASDSVLVIFKKGTQAAERHAVARGHGLSLRDRDGDGRDDRMKHVMGGRIAKLSLAKGQDRDALLKRLARHPAIEVAEPNYLLHANATPDDSRFGELWGLHNTGQSGGTVDADIDAPEAWDITTGSRSVIVGVIDTGVDYSHPDLQANMWVNPGEIAGNGVDDDGNGVVDDIHGFSAYNDNGDPMDGNGHGTHVAGTIGASGNNGSGVAGVNWEVTIIGCQFLSPSGSGSSSDAIECIDYMTDLKVNRGIDIKATNNSWGGGGYSEALKGAIDTAGNAGILFVAAAGNDSSDGDSSPHYPSSYDSDAILAVASTDRNDNMSGFSNYGLTSVDLGAPGSSILSTVPGGGYDSYSGTSMASPHVAGAAALIWSINPDLSPVEMKQLLMDSGDELPALVGKTVSGKRINLASALDAADPTPGFKLSTSPANQEIVAGDSAQYLIDVGSIADWSGDVALSLATSPALPGASLSASTAQPGDQVSLDVVTTAETQWGSYTLTVTGDNGEMQKQSTVTLDVLPQGLSDFSYSNSTPVAINDNSTSTSTIEVTELGTVFGVEANVNISHTYSGDLIVSLISPAGTEHVLHNRSGGSADDVIGSWTLDSFNGEAMNGTWTLSVSDNASADTGTLNSWGMTITAKSDGGSQPQAPVADFSASVDGLNVAFTDASSDADNNIVDWSWNFGDGNGASEVNPSHSYASGGTYTVTLTVTDADGLSDTASQQVTVAESSIELSLKRSSLSRRGNASVDLQWSGATGALVDIYRDGVLIDSTDNDGRYRDRFSSNGGDYLYQICEAGSSNCSAELTVSL
ncbi:S8 family serine peptidase [Gallaecimonas sp. GXIMD4217]|uniref:S8 family serine peptidase n=1 Tax=Gallaecimonas sp. GXIMD4217 TaxID=3131927 RepID=UPI00311B33AF